MIWYLLRGLGGNQLDDRRVDLELREVDRGNAVLLAEQGGDLFVLDEAELDEVDAELAAVGLLIVQRLLQLRRRDALFFEQQLADADGHRVRPCGKRLRLSGPATDAAPSACYRLERGVEGENKSVHH